MCIRDSLINERKDFQITKKDCLKEFDDKDQINSLLLNYDIHISTLMFRKKILESMTYFFDKRFNIIEDFDFVLRLSRSARIKINKNFLATYRWHSNKYFSPLKQLITTLISGSNGSVGELISFQLVN